MPKHPYMTLPFITLPADPTCRIQLNSSATKFAVMWYDDRNPEFPRAIPKFHYLEADNLTEAKVLAVELGFTKAKIDDQTVGLS